MYIYVAAVVGSRLMTCCVDGLCCVGKHQRQASAPTACNGQLCAAAWAGEGTGWSPRMC